MVEKSVESIPGRYISYRQRVLRGMAILGLTAYGSLARPEPVEAEGTCGTGVKVESSATRGPFDILVRDAVSGQVVDEFTLASGQDMRFFVNSNATVNGQPGFDAYYYTRSHPEYATRIATICGISGARLFLRDVQVSPPTYGPLPPGVVVPPSSPTEQPIPSDINLNHYIDGRQAPWWVAVPLLSSLIIAAGLLSRLAGVVIQRPPAPHQGRPAPEPPLVPPREPAGGGPQPPESPDATRRRAESDLRATLAHEDLVRGELDRAIREGRPEEVQVARERMNTATTNRLQAQSRLNALDPGAGARISREVRRTPPTMAPAEGQTEVRQRGQRERKEKTVRPAEGGEYDVTVDLPLRLRVRPANLEYEVTLNPLTHRVVPERKGKRTEREDEEHQNNEEG